MKYISICSGIEAASVAWHHMGWQPVAFSEIDKFPSAVLKNRFPDIPNLGDFTKIGDEYDGEIDVLVGGPPCFTGDTLIACSHGLVPIRDVRDGDEVLTHEGRYKKVLGTGSKSAKTIVLKGQGQSAGVHTTSEHPFYSITKGYVLSSDRRYADNRKAHETVFSDPEWVDAKDMKGKMWASPSLWPESFPPPFEYIGNEKPAPVMTEKIAWIIGRWLGDGWCRINKRRGSVIIRCAFDEAEELKSVIAETDLMFCQVEERTVVEFHIGGRAFARWLTENFGSGAGEKTMPTWVFGWKYKRALFDGYISAYGHKVKGGRRLTTISQKLALGSLLLAQSLGYGTSRDLVKPSRKECVIEEGRVVNERPFWQITIRDTSTSSVNRGMHRWGLVRKVEPGPENVVYNLEVEEDNSYVADGIVVHNCQDFSYAGKRTGVSGERGGLTLKYVELCARMRPRWIVYENVPGLLSVDGGHTFKAFLDALQDIGYICDVDILNAQFFGVPQRRKRIFVCGQHRDDLMAQKTTSSALTIAQCLIEICHAMLPEIPKPVKKRSKPKPRPLGLSADGMRRRINLFDLKPKSESWVKVRENLEEECLRSGFPVDMLMFLPNDNCEDLIATTGASWKSILRGLSSVLSSSDTDLETVNMKIYICSLVVLNLSNFVAYSDTSSPCHWSADLSASEALKGFINYAKFASGEVSRSVGWVRAWSDFIEQAERPKVARINSGEGASVQKTPAERESMCGNIEKSQEAQSETTTVSGESSAECGECESRSESGRWPGFETTHALTDRYDSSEDGCGRGVPIISASQGDIEKDPRLPIAYAHNQGGNIIEQSIDDMEKEDINQGVSGTLLGSGAGTERPAGCASEIDFLVVEIHAFQTRIARNGRGDMGDKINALQASSSHTSDAAPCVAITEIEKVKDVSCIGFSHCDNGRDIGTVAPTLRSRGGVNTRDSGNGNAAVIITETEGQDCEAFTQNQRDEVRTMKVCGALAAETGTKQQTYLHIKLPHDDNDVEPIENTDSSGQEYGVETRQRSVVRRLTAIECERLQGFPDEWTKTPWRKNPADSCPDGPRYKSLGNSMAVPCIIWIGERIKMTDKA